MNGLNKHWSEDSPTTAWKKLQPGEPQKHKKGSDGERSTPEAATESEQRLEAASKVVREACERICAILDALVKHYDEQVLALSSMLDKFSGHANAINEFFNEHPNYRREWTGPISWRKICEYKNSMDGLVNSILTRLSEVSRKKEEILGKVQSGVATLPADQGQAATQLYTILDDTVRSIRTVFDKVLELVQGLGGQAEPRPLKYFVREAGDQAQHFGSSMRSGALGKDFFKIQAEVEYIENLAQKLEALQLLFKEEVVYSPKMGDISAIKNAAENSLASIVK